MGLPHQDSQPGGDYLINRIMEEGIADDHTAVFRVRWIAYGPDE